MKIPSVCSIELNFYRYTFCIKKHYLNWSMVLTLLQHRWKYVFYKSKEYDDLVILHLKRHHGNNERPDPTSSVLTNNELFM